METNSKEDMWRVVRTDRRGVHIKFILLNPRSHSAVLIGNERIEFSRHLRLGPMSLPCESLKSRY